MASFTNQATLEYNGAISNSNVVVGEIVEVLSATKDAVNPSYMAGDVLTYVINIINTGTTPYNNLTVSDNLGAYTVGTTTVIPLDYVTNTVKYYVNGVLQTTPTVTGVEPLTITGINVPAGGNATIIYDAQLNNFAPLTTTSSINNVATISGTGVTTFTADETVNAALEPDLSITKTVSPVPVTENGTLTYTFVIQNNGNTATEISPIITDTFNPVLSNVTATYNGTAMTLGTDYNYNTTTGLFTTTGEGITVPAATYTQNPTTGVWSTTPGTATIVVTGTV